MAKRNRCKQVQLNRLVELAENNVDSYRLPATKNSIWKQITKELNALGPKKTLTEWKQCFRMLKFNTSKKYKNYKNGAPNIELTNRDKRIIALSTEETNDSVKNLIQTIQETQVEEHSIRTSLDKNALRICSICTMQFRLSTELLLHKLQYHSAPTISTHLGDLLVNETVHASDIEYDYTFTVTTTYQRKPKSIVKTELNCCEENDIGEIETSDEVVDTEYLHGWPLSEIFRPVSTIWNNTTENSIEIKPNFKDKMHSTVEKFAKHEDSGIFMDESVNSADIKHLDTKPKLSTPDTKPIFPIRAYSCVMCTRSFDKKKYLKVHMLTHTLNRPRYSCDICSKSFVTRTYKKLHKETSCVGLALKLVQGHEKKQAVIKKKPVKPYECEICGKRFRLKSHLNLHVKIHYESMEPCDVSTSEGIDLKHHHSVKIHVKGRAYECALGHKEMVLIHH